MRHPCTGEKIVSEFRRSSYKELSPADPRSLGEHVILAALKASSKERNMPKGYWVVSGDVTDPEGYKAYIAANATALAKHGARFLVRGGKSAVVEGWGYSRTVVVEFEGLRYGLGLLPLPQIYTSQGVSRRKGRSEHCCH
jgi:uncharacterized protein (DUF1330 family)